MVLNKETVFPFSQQISISKGGSMQKNVGTTDKVVRIILGIVLIILGIFYLENWLQIVAIFFGAVFLITGLVGRCGLYIPFGISTCKVEKTAK